MMGQQGKRSRISLEKLKEESGPCTYEMGSVRQDVWICLKCTVDGQVAGFCSACAIACHGSSSCGEHELVNLYAKRGFRCDCGNSRMKNDCVLCPGKQPVNDKNNSVYSHNFQERYCRCNQGLLANLGGMEQCCMCEDWFHHKCINAAGLSPKGSRAKLFRKAGLVYEFTCFTCVAKLPILRRYYAELGFSASKLLTLPRSFAKKVSSEEARPSDCELPTVDISKLPDNVDILWKEGFRKRLCTCAKCEAIYASAKASFITSIPDIEGEYAEAADGSDVLLDGTDDIAILNDVIAEEETGVDASRFSLPKKRSLYHLGSGHGTHDDGEASRQLDEWKGGEARIAIQNRIHRFLESVIASNGERMTEKDLFAYIADVKAEVQASALANGGAFDTAGDER